MMNFLHRFKVSLLVGVSLLGTSSALGQQGPNLPNVNPNPVGPNSTDTTLPNPNELTPPLSPDRVEIDRPALEKLVLEADPGVAVQAIEEYQALSYADYLDLQLFGQVPTASEISQRLTTLGRRTGNNPAIVYAFALQDQLVLLLVLPQSQTPVSRSISWIASATGAQGAPSDPPLRYVVADANRAALELAVKTFRQEVSNPGKVGTTSYLNAAQQLYQWLIAPLEPALAAHRIDTLIFSLDQGLRSLPMAALHNRRQFLVENYSIALVPSFGLTNTRYLQLTPQSSLLGVGISKPTQGQAPLPAVAVEVPTLATTLWSGQPLLDEAATLDNLKNFSQRQPFGIVHLATHAKFRSGNVRNSYIQLWDRRLHLGELRQLSRDLGWSQPQGIELLVLSACQTALGNREAELGFSGLALQSGVKTALGSLWYVGDEASLGLMTGFYRELQTAPIKTEALRQAQLALLRGQVRLESGALRLSENLRIPLPPELANRGNQSFAHPYFWSAYTMIGNWN